MSCDLGETWNSWIIKIQKCRLKLDKSSLLPPFNLLERESFSKTPHHKWPGLLWFNQGSTSCAMLPSRMGEHGVSWVNMENMKYQPDDLNHSIYSLISSFSPQFFYSFDSVSLFTSIKYQRNSKAWRYIRKAFLASEELDVMWLGGDLKQLNN